MHGFWCLYAAYTQKETGSDWHISLLSLRQQHSCFCGFYNILVIISPLLPLLPSNHLTLPLLTCCSSLCCQYHLQYLSRPMFVCYSRRDSLSWEQTSLTSMGRWWWAGSAEGLRLSWTKDVSITFIFLKDKLQKHLSGWCVVLPWGPAVLLNLFFYVPWCFPVFERRNSLTQWGIGFSAAL